MKPRKHAELIKAWADGCVIQGKGKSSGDWQDLEVPGWHDHMEYRIKPEVIRYRRYLYKYTYGDYGVRTHNEPSSGIACNCHLQDGFIRWIDIEWQEVEV